MTVETIETNPIQIIEDVASLVRPRAQGPRHRQDDDEEHQEHVRIEKHSVSARIGPGRQYRHRRQQLQSLLHNSNSAAVCPARLFVKLNCWEIRYVRIHMVVWPGVLHLEEMIPKEILFIAELWGAGRNNAIVTEKHPWPPHQVWHFPCFSRLTGILFLTASASCEDPQSAHWIREVSCMPTQEKKRWNFSKRSCVPQREGAGRARLCVQAPLHSNRQR